MKFKGDALMLLPFPSEEQKKIIEAKRYAKGLYADKPGTGPSGETCGSCKHLYHKSMAKTYLKCALMQALWTGGGGTDIKAKAPACSKWQARNV
jgi:hypothetical protein